MAELTIVYDCHNMSQYYKLVQLQIEITYEDEQKVKVNQWTGEPPFTVYILPRFKARIEPCREDYGDFPCAFPFFLIGPFLIESKK